MDYAHIRQYCSHISKLTQHTIDDFLIHYGAQQDKLAREADEKLKPYKHITRKQDPGWEAFIKTQYIAFRIFKKDGLISRYLTHSGLKHLTAQEMSYLKHQSDTPWRFCFSEITGNPSDDFYEMEDILSGENFLLYSRGTTRTLQSGNRALWFNLLAFNGLCWQTFGPINGYKGFTADDIFFYATELNPSLQDEADIIQHIEDNPVPYMMLFSGSEMPIMINRNELVIFQQTEIDMDMPLPGKANLQKDFKSQEAGEVTLYNLKRWGGFPHFARFYHDRHKKILQLHAMTERGYQELTKKMKAAGLAVPYEADISVTMNMLTTAGSILKREIVLDEYGPLFQPETSPHEMEEIDDLNHLVQMIVTDLNAGREPNVTRLSKESGFDEQTVKEIISKMQKVKGGR